MQLLELLSQCEDHFIYFIIYNVSVFHMYVFHIFISSIIHVELRVEQKKKTFAVGTSHSLLWTSAIWRLKLAIEESKKSACVRKNLLEPANPASYAGYNSVSKVIRIWFCTTTLSDWLKNSHHFFFFLSFFFNELY